VKRHYETSQLPGGMADPAYSACHKKEGSVDPALHPNPEELPTMKSYRHIFLFAAAGLALSLPVTPLAAAETAATPPAVEADEPKQPRPDRSAPEVEHYRWAFGSFLRDFVSARMDFYTRHPEDPRRWEAVMQIQNVFMDWDGGLQKEAPEVVAEVNKVMSAQERASRRQKITELEAALHVSSDVPGSVRLYFEGTPFRKRLRAAGEAKLKPTAPSPHPGFRNWPGRAGRRRCLPALPAASSGSGPPARR